MFLSSRFEKAKEMLMKVWLPHSTSKKALSVLITEYLLSNSDTWSSPFTNRKQSLLHHYHLVKTNKLCQAWSWCIYKHWSKSIGLTLLQAVANILKTQVSSFHWPGLWYLRASELPCILFLNFTLERPVKVSYMRYLCAPECVLRKVFLCLEFLRHLCP